jgi:penicillin-insensitive murein endopeptidase
VRRLARCAGRKTFFGTIELVQMLERSAAQVAARGLPAPLQVGDLSGLLGGPLRGHRSHQNGRDADLAFYVHDAAGRSARSARFLAFGRFDPPAPTTHPLRFDDRRNWALVAALLSDPHARVQYVFVARELRDRLLVEGWRAGASTELLRSAAAVLVEPERGQKHDDHFHLRIFCASSDQPACQDQPPFWPWYRGNPPTQQYAPLPIIRWPALAAAGHAPSVTP